MRTFLATSELLFPASLNRVDYDRALGPESAHKISMTLFDEIQMNSASDIDMKCDNLRIHTKEDMHLNSEGELTIESTEELHINCEMDIRLRGKVIWLN